MKKVIVVGSHGTGKSVLSERLVEECRSVFPLKKIGVLDGLADTVRKRGHKLNVFESQSQAIRAQLLLLRLYLDAIRSAESDILIVPDNVVRQLVYSDYNSMPHEWLDLLRYYLKDELRDAIVLYVPIEFALPWDRHPSPTFHKQIDEMTLELLEDHNVPYVTVKGDVETRVKTAVEAIRGFCES